MRALDVAGRGHERQAAEREVGAQAFECPRVLRVVELVLVSAGEFGEPFAVASEPGAKRRAGRDVPFPGVDTGLVLHQPARPRPIDQDASTVLGAPILDHPADANVAVMRHPSTVRPAMENDPVNEHCWPVSAAAVEAAVRV